MLIKNNNINTRNKLGNKLGMKPNNIGKTQYTKNKFCSRSYKIYNSIACIITSIPKKEIFKKYLKKYLMNNNNLPHPNVYKIVGLVVLVNFNSDTSTSI